VGGVLLARCSSGQVVFFFLVRLSMSLVRILDVSAVVIL
jgi:hypothetical protein